MGYNINDVANDLLVEPEDLREVYDAYFMESADIMTAIQTALNNHDAPALKKLFHSLKGSSANLRMNAIADLAKNMEQFAETGNVAAINTHMSRFAAEIHEVQQEIKKFYR